jgi:uncharacterized protein YndB with AHSA1/START domain
MKFLKKAGIALLAVIAFILVLSFLLPTTIKIERDMVIATEPEVAYNYVNDLRNWERWSYWHTKDPGQKLIYSQNPVGKGAFYKWNGEINQTGTITVDSIEPNKAVYYTMQFADWTPNSCAATFEPVSGGVKVTMKMEMNSKPPMNLMMNLFKGEIAAEYDKCLVMMDSVANYDRTKAN